MPLAVLLWCAWCWVWAVKPMIGLTRLGIDPPALKNLLIAYVGGLFGRFVVMAVIYFVLAIVLGVLVSRHKKHRA